MTAILLASLLAAAAPAKGKGRAPSRQEAPDTEAPSLLHTPIREAQLNHELIFEAEIFDPSGIFEPLLYWRLAGARGQFATVKLEPKAGKQYSAALPSTKVTADLEYFLEAYDTQGNGPSRVGSSAGPIRVKVTAAAPVGAAPPAAVAPKPEAPVRLGPIITVGAGTVLLGVGALLYLNASSTVGEIDAKYAKGAGRSPADFEATQSAIARSRIGSILMIAGGVGAAGGATWYFVPGGAALQCRF